MYRLTVVAIPGCALCEEVTNSLIKANIPYKYVDANTHDSLCDMLEVLLITKTYPIVTFETPARSYFLCFPETEERLGWKVLDETSTSIGFTELDEMISQLYDFTKQ